MWDIAVRNRTTNVTELTETVRWQCLLCVAIRLKQLEQCNAAKKSSAETDVANAIGASVSWVRHFTAGRETGLSHAVAVKIGRLYKTLCETIERDAQRMEALNEAGQGNDLLDQDLDKAENIQKTLATLV